MLRRQQMALTLENEFVVAGPLEPTWGLLLDLERVASCLPGASVEPAGADGSLPGRMRVKLGPVTMEYKGTARLERVDEETRTAVVRVDGRETRGQGTASATIASSLSPADGGTLVRVHTELSVTGRPAQFGRGIMQDVAARMLADFATCLSRQLAESPNGNEPVQPQAAPPLDLTAAVRGALAGRFVRVAGLAALAGLLTRAARRFRRR